MWSKSALAAAAVLGLIALPTQTAVPAEKADPLVPKGHFKIKRPAQLTKGEALTVYEQIGDDIGRGYAASGDATATAFRGWRRYNDAPYKSATHGNRYVNNYANSIARGVYDKLKANTRMPAGSILAKDSFTVTADRAVFAGALFIMEKLQAGGDPDNGDWRYIMIMPDGSYLGDSRGDNADKVVFCHDCHVAVANSADHLFFLPKKYRRKFLGE